MRKGTAVSQVSNRIEVGGRALLLSETFCVPPSEEVRIFLEAMSGPDAEIRIAFVYDPEYDQNKIKTRSKDYILELLLVNFGTVGTQVGTTNGIDILIGPEGNEDRFKAYIFANMVKGGGEKPTLVQFTFTLYSARTGE